MDRGKPDMQQVAAELATRIDECESGVFLDACTECIERIARALTEQRHAAFRECEQVLWGRVEREAYGHAKAAVTLDIEAIRAHCPEAFDQQESTRNA